MWSEEEGSLGGDLGAVAQVAVSWGEPTKNHTRLFERENDEFVFEDLGLS